jgi:parallel beta-helix repeat protein
MKKAIILLVIIALPIFLLGTTYTVKQDGTGDFITIQDAIDYVDDDDEIIVYEGTYNEQIYFLGKNILVASRYHTTGNQQYIDDTVISYQSNPFLGVVNFSNGEINTELKGFTIQDGYIGVNITNCDSPIIQNCIITENINGIFIRLTGGPTFLHPQIIDNKIINNEVVGIFCADDTYPKIINNLIENNVVGIHANGVEIDEEVRSCYPTINGNKFENNTTGTGIKLERAVAEMNGNLFVNQQYVISMIGYSNLVFINNCTIYDNNQLIIGALFDIHITNSIIRNLVMPIPQYLQINYSNIVGGYTGIGNIDEDPLFEDPANNIFTLKWNETEKSPCIDTGDPDHQYNDPDGTRADMGALYHEHEVKTYEFPNQSISGNWKWLSFDILDRTPDPYNIAQNMLLPIRPDDLLDYAEFKDHGTNTWVERIEYDWVLGTWENGDHPFTSPYGYKFHTWDTCSLEIPGFRCEASTRFFVAGDDEANWIGYFLNRTLHVYDAFDGYLDNIYAIQAQHWSVRSPWPVVPYTLSPGDMVVVWCRRDIRNFFWNADTPREPFNIEEPQSFSYEEESDYIPIYMQLDPEDLPTEIGALIDGECKGATVVQDTSAQICAYILECQGSSLEFEFYYGGREENKIIKEYNVYDPETSLTEKGTIKVENNRDCYYVSFKNEPESTPVPARLEASNYPNPFNPVTTITYSLPEDSQISISIYNIKGQKVKTLVTGTQPAGDYNVSWNGKDESGKEVTSGIYFYKLKTQQNEITRKMLLLK